MKKIIILIYMIALTAVTFFVSLETAASTSLDNRHIFEQLSETNSIKQEETIFQVSLGNNHSLALTSSSRLFSWGRNDNGQLGDGTAIDTHTPSEITASFNLSSGEIISQVSLGIQHSSALTSNGRLFTWGDNFFGRLGDGTIQVRRSPIEITANFNLIPDETITQVSLGGSHSSALTSHSRIFTWGNNTSGELGDGTTINKTTPVEITSGFNLIPNETITQVSLGGEYSSALTSSGRLFMWGLNGHGQLGDGTTTNRDTPTEITSRFNLIPNETITQVSLGRTHSAALTSSGRIFRWGNNTNNQLGDGTTTNRNTPVDITDKFNLATDETIIGVTLGALHSSALTSSGRLFTWGWNNSGQLGDATTTQRATPVDITERFNLNEGELISKISLGGGHSSALTSNGQLFTWGWNFFGQLGDGTTTNKSTPLEITAGFNFIKEYTISFNSNGGSFVDDIVFEEDLLITAPVSPTRLGYTFSGWYSDVLLTEAYTFQAMPSENLTVYAKWTLQPYTITYNLNDGVNNVNNQSTYTIETQTINVLQPTKNGHTFVGWYTNSDFTGNVISEIPLGTTGNQVLYAKFNINTYTITFNSNGGDLVQPITLDFDAIITGISTPTREGYVFNGYSQVIPARMPAEDLTITLYWRKVEIASSVDVNIEVLGLFEAIDPLLTTNKNIEVTLILETKTEEEILESDQQLITSIAKRNERVQFLDIRVILKEQGFDDVEISRLTQHVSITMTLDEAIKGNRNYRIVRLHEGVLEILETIYDEENQTLTFETDRFSNYAIMYQVDEDSSFIGILMIALIITLGLLAWYYRFFILLLFKRKKEDDEEEHKEVKQRSKA